jgi:hypothetical protein
VLLGCGETAIRFSPPLTHTWISPCRRRGRPHKRQGRSALVPASPRGALRHRPGGLIPVPYVAQRGRVKTFFLTFRAFDV